MAARAYWQGQIRLALVSIPVELYAATKSGATIAFHQIHEPTGKRIKYEKVAPGVGTVDPEDIKKGFEYEKGAYVLLEPEEIDAVKLESKKTLELTQFVDAHEIDALYFEKPYYVVPADDLAEEAFVVLREALRRTRKVGLGQLTLRGREYIVSLKPCGRGIILETLRYAEEVHKAQGYFRDIPDIEPDEELLELAETLIEKKAAPFKPDRFHDRYVDALRALVDRKLKSKGGVVAPAPDEERPSRGSNVVDLMAALKKSLEKSGADSGAPPAKAATRRPAAAKTAKPPAKSAAKPAAPAKKRAPSRKRASA